RGVYFTSGTQEGTPIDRVMGALSRTFGLTRRNPAAQAGARGRSFFLSALLHKVIFEERGLVSINAAAERRRTVWRWSVIGVTGIAAVAMLAGWLISYSRNTAYANEVVARVPALRQSVAGLPTAQSADVAPLIQPLSAVRDAALPAFALDAPPLLNTLGLYQGDKLDAAAKLSYRRLLDHALLPRVTQRLEERLRAANRDNLEGSYEALKSYLMLYSPDQFDRDTLKAWIGIDWDAQYAASLAPEQRRELDAHLDALLADGAPRATAPMDKALVASVRDMLVAFPLDYRIYSRLKRQAVGNDIAEFSVARAAGPNAAQVFMRASREPLTRGVPGLYTREGYQRLFQQAPLQQAAVQLANEQAWVLGLKSDPSLQKETALNSALTTSVRRLYLNDYVKQWDAYLADVKLVKLDSLARSVEIARMLGGTDSPLSAFLREATAQTTLVPAAAAAASVPAAGNPLADKAKAAREAMRKLAGGQPTGAPAAAGADQPIERIVDDHFIGLHRLFQGQPAPIEEQQKLFNEAYTQLAAIDAAQKSKSPPPAGGGGDKLKAAAGQQPELVRTMVDALVDVGAKQGRAAERDVLTAELKPITDFCQKSIANRYPVAAGSRADVLPDDFGQLFGNGGMLDEFYQRRLASLVDTGKATWVYKPLADGSVPASPAALAEFQRAARIKEAFFRSGGKTPGFRLDIRATELADGLKELVIDIDGQPLKFVAGSNAAVTVSWPSQRVASEIKLSTVPATSPVSFEGPWALFRLFDRFDVQASDRPEKFGVLLNLDGKRVRLDVTANSVLNPFRLRELRQFRCPGAL
ncbi:MAG: type VI secretion system membrane subunit TssM, partial [Burkholderiales bacterium]